MNLQRIRINEIKQRSIRSIRIIETPAEIGNDKDKPQPNTSRRNSSRQPNNDLSPDGAITRRKNALRSVCSSIEKQNVQPNGNYQTVQDLLKKHNKSPVSKLPKQQVLSNKQKNQAQYIQKMLQKLTIKQAKQLQQLKQLSSIPEQIRIAEKINKGLKQQLLEMKQLMKCLLLERQEMRMFSFYQDQ